MPKCLVVLFLFVQLDSLLLVVPSPTVEQRILNTRSVPKHSVMHRRTWRPTTKGHVNITACKSPKTLSTRTSSPKRLLKELLRFVGEER